MVYTFSNKKHIVKTSAVSTKRTNHDMK